MAKLARKKTDMRKFTSHKIKKLTWLESHLTIGANHLTLSDLPPAQTLMRVLHLGQWGRGEPEKGLVCRQFESMPPFRSVLQWLSRTITALKVPDLYFFFQKCSTPTELCNTDLVTLPTLPPRYFNRVNEHNYLSSAFK